MSRSASLRWSLEQVEEFAALSVQLESIADLASLFDAFARDLGFRYHALVPHLFGAAPNADSLVFVNYPPAWVETFLTRGYHRDDPVHRTCQETLSGFAWEQMPRFISLDPRQIEIVEQGIKVGLGAGYTVPLHLPGFHGASCSFATRPGLALPDHAGPAAECGARIVLEQAQRILGDKRWFARPRLTPRQRECTELMMLGKTDWEIGRILGISEDTVTKYLDAARQRYGVMRRTQLAVAGLLEEEIKASTVRSWA